LVCRTTDPDESKEGAETSEIRIKCETSQVIGTSSAVLRNDIIRMRTHEPCLSFAAHPHFHPHVILSPLFAYLSAGAVDKIILPVGMQTVNFACTKVTGNTFFKLREWLLKEKVP